MAQKMATVNDPDIYIIYKKNGTGIVKCRWKSWQSHDMTAKTLEQRANGEASG